MAFVTHPARAATRHGTLSVWLWFAAACMAVACAPKSLVADGTDAQAGDVSLVCEDTISDACCCNNGHLAGEPTCTGGKYVCPNGSTMAYHQICWNFCHDSSDVGADWSQDLPDVDLTDAQTGDETGSDVEFDLGDVTLICEDTISDACCCKNGLMAGDPKCTGGKYVCPNGSTMVFGKVCWNFCHDSSDADVADWSQDLWEVDMPDVQGVPGD